jgi:hypothetical protein
MCSLGASPSSLLWREVERLLAEEESIQPALASFRYRIRTSDAPAAPSAHLAHHANEQCAGVVLTSKFKQPTL